MPEITCVRCGRTGAQLPGPPLPGELGQRIHSSICDDCWRQWLRHQTQVINHYGLDLRTPDARKLLTQQTEAFLFGAGKQG
jgi:Fe-S cluster biosynthesis and repair protein YggX